MDKLKTLFNSYFWLIVIVWLAAIVALVIWLGSGPSEGERFNQTVTNQTTEANKAVREAANHNNAAVNVSIERRTEDAARDRIIKPKLDNARRQSESSKAALDEARRTYENAKNPKNLDKILDNSLADNCAELARLYPDIRFDDCPGN